MTTFSPSRSAHPSIAHQLHLGVASRLDHTSIRRLRGFEDHGNDEMPVRVRGKLRAYWRWGGAVSVAKYRYVLHSHNSMLGDRIESERPSN